MKPSIDIYLDGRKVDTDRLSDLPSEDSVAVYESLRSYQGIVFRLREHLKRLDESRRTIGLILPKSLQKLEKEVRECAATYRKGDKFLRLTVNSRHSYLFVTERNRPEHIYKVGVHLKTSTVRRNHINAWTPAVKTNAFFNNVLAVLDGLGDARFDSIFLDAKGYLTEGTIWNIFIVKAGKIYTPAAGGILNGVTRQYVIECAEKEGISVVEMPLTRHDFWNSDEAFITNTSGEIVPVRSLDGRLIGAKIPGRMTLTLIKRFKQDINKKLKRKI
ncbi:MAG: hypothetical protein A3G33_05645 [Omnitrophica bacterium RIFCSPLOWO2_12_FULL_44_17]|uniref:branched-chain-amino-acid transaminase n=1 Tax=Candidatus Danuiimicrobium aquiferis TaxID=1801832 RepID=A0A1G1L344_9BACT|nr:MAG: hypothetical protein A3B72_05125 [Omnitrophica bacterium RIFCSPHIGHO2_02_FULL_45_28]OGW99556.1 MAG: hypothetical protein A3G33_05645 [Omnitrophica bacterium RIFCSPLOWO2_12_FULL_44_17]OGX04005.1 MAG: hypothetical protein A3J12_06185 [Omnitrophica bacterium RIFCSPLOWO2_02_FULL_44_11]